MSTLLWTLDSAVLVGTEAAAPPASDLLLVSQERLAAL